MSDDWQPTACILCSSTAASRCALDGRRIARVRGDKAHPASQGYTCEKALRLDHYQNGRDRLTTPAAAPRRRHVRGDRLGHRDRRGRRAARARCATTHGGESIFYYGGGGQGNHLGGGYGRATRAALGCVYTLERAGAGEDRRVLGRRPAVRPAAVPHDRRLRARRGRGVRRQEPVAVARLPARARRAQGDRQGSRRAR